MDKTYLGQRLAQFTPGMAHRPITRVNLLDSNGDLLHTAGNDEGGTLEAVNPDATQAMAEAILASVQGFTYRPYEGQDAVLDPAAELGDGITVGGTYSLLGRSDTTFDLLTTSEIGAPAGDEINDEYPYRDPIQKLIQRNIQSVRSFITKTAKEINLTVEDLSKEVGTTLRVSADGVTITDGAGNAVTISGGQVSADGLTVNAANINGTLSANQINSNGLKVSAANVTGKLEASQIETDDLAVKAANVSGVLSASSLDLDGLLELKLGSTSYGWMGVNTNKGGPVICDSTKSVFFVATPSAAKISYYDTKAVYVSNGNIGLQFSGKYVKYTGGAFYSEDTATLGTSTYKWGQGYATASTFNTSDRNQKHDIEDLPQIYLDLFSKLRPVRYKFNDGTSGRYHVGFIAQEVEDAMAAVGLSSQDFGGFGKDVHEVTGEDIYMLRYEEFIGILAAKVMQLDQIVNGGAI